MQKLPVIVILGLLLSISALPAFAQPALEVSAPGDGAVVQGNSVTVNFQVNGIQLVKSTVPIEEAGLHPEANRDGEGHLHFMLDLAPLVVWEQNSPYTFSNIPAGEHVLMVELVNNDHSPLSPPIVQQVRFQTVAGTVMPNTGGRYGPFGGKNAVAGTLILLSASLVLLGLALPRLRSRARTRGGHID